MRDATARRRLRVTGTVQGVGFRPFVHRNATALGLSGSVRNDSAGVLIEIEGAPESLDEFCRRLADEAPRLARIETIDSAVVPVNGGEPGFVITESDDSGAPNVPVSIDTAACAECLAEVDDPGNRRYRYPFTNCTNCGPRYTIVVSVPYDRPATTMASFPMCDACRREYHDPSDRRFHAQPIACRECGPTLAFCTPSGEAVVSGDAALDATVDALESGQIVGVKGIGGFHLAVDATNRDAVAELRRRKHRDDKPFALMMPDMDAARLLCDLSPPAEAALAAPGRPIVLAPRRIESKPALAADIAPGLPELGIMLPYTPLHHLLLARVARPLVMTSGNLTDEPIVHIDDDAFERLGPLVDAVLTHDRPIHIRCDDSVVRAVGDRTLLVRRSRGYVPQPLALPAPSRRQVLAVGAELKNTVSVVKGSSIVTSHHIGDLEHLAAHRSFVQAVDHLCDLFGVTPEVVVHDMHPEYLSTKWALETDLPVWSVQHHHAHIASCLAEHQYAGRVLGVAFDGLGYGCDRTLWGGEFLDANLTGFERIGHLRAAPLPGGAAAVREPWRMALTWVHLAMGAETARREGSKLDDRTPSVLELIQGGQAPVTTSVGRCFDAVAALLGLRSSVTYEGQAAIELEALARTVPRNAAPVYPVDVIREGDVLVLDPAPLVVAVVEARELGTPPALIAAGFHEGLGRGAARLATELALERDLDVVALSGGVFQNARLTDVVESELQANGLTVLVHGAVPSNDGGISVGQAAIAATAEHLP